MTNEKELNEKLLIWLGYKRAARNQYWWEDEKGDTLGNWPHFTPPDFTQDISACLEHLGPKFVYVKMYLSQKDNTAKVEIGTGDEYFESDLTYSEGLPLAFSRAAEEAIDKGAK